MSSRVVKETATRAVAAGSKKLSKTIVVSRAAKRRHAEVSYESNESPPATSKLKTERGAKEPPKWRQQLNNIRKMRENRDAPVDQEGAKALSDSSASPEVYRYQVLVSLMLSSMTKDHVTAEAMKRLKAEGLSVQWMIATKEERIAELIKPVGFWKRKAGYLKRTAAILDDQYNGDIPDTIENLVSLPGVGPKMANLTMDIAWDSVTGIGVDTHVHRITHRLGWVSGASDPEATRTSLEEWLPRSLWSELNWLVVGFGQTICRPVRPHCKECLNKHICPAAKDHT